MRYRLTYLDQLEAESVHIFREVVATCERPVMLYSVGKDSSVMLHLARKAFAPAPLPFPLLHVDTGYKPREMIAFRDETARQLGAELIVARNEPAIAAGCNPYDIGPSACCGQLKTGALLAGLARGGYDAAFGGARRDEERSRAKERIVSVRDPAGGWDPRRQRPELWSTYNTRLAPGESLRVFPLSNWTELDVWRYVAREAIPVVPLYFAREREVVEQGGALLVTEHFPLPARIADLPRRVVRCRFRSLGCLPCSGAVRSEATDVAGIIAEMEASKTSERAGRLIDRDVDAAMEKKKREGYF